MSEEGKRERIFISAVEPSADGHCANLIRALRKIKGDIDFVGVGGPRMSEAGCKLLRNPISRASMGYKSFAHIFS